MPTEQFTKEEFETVLPRNGSPLWEYFGFDQGEHVYVIPVKDGSRLTNKRIVIRSSIGQNGKAAKTGGDSIRHWIEYYYPKAEKWFSMGKVNTGKYTTREPGWAERMIPKLRTMYREALADSRRRGEEGYMDNGDETSPLETIGKGNQITTLPIEENAKHDPIAFDYGSRAPNAEQKLAIEAPVDSAVRVLAPPGSGKTFVISYRYAYLIEAGVQPEQIVAVTFNRTMADELLARIAKVSPQIVDTSATEQVSTIHAFCYRRLKDEGDGRRVAKNWQVKKELREISEDLWQYSEERPGWEELNSYISTAKSKGLTTTDDLRWFSKTAGEYHGARLHECRKRFDAQMGKHNLLTFSDMLLDVETKLKTNRLFREKLQNRYTHVIVDEGQDTTAQAMRILTTIAQPQNNFFIVGDTDQLLYRFAGATPEANLYHGFEEQYADGLTVKLSVNYRSTQTIIDTYDHLITHNYSSRGGPYDEDYHKAVQGRPGVEHGEPISYMIYSNVHNEARAVSESIAEQCANGRDPNDFFIGARTRAQLGYLEGHLVRAGIPFINIAGGSFWGAKHVADLVAYLHLAYVAMNNQLDSEASEAFSRIYNIGSNWSVYPWGDKQGEYCTHRFLGKAFLEACFDSDIRKPSYKWVQYAVSKRKSFAPGVEDMTMLVQEIQAEIANCTVAEALQYIIDNCLEKYLRHEEGLTDEDSGVGNGKLDDLQTVVDIAERFDNVQAFLDYVNGMRESADAAKSGDWNEHVILSTIHRLKGLERPVVYGIGLSEGHSMTGLLQGLLPHTYSMIDPPQNGVLPVGGKGRIEDERCIAFVLVSRAQEEVHLSGCELYRKMILGPSRFIKEMGLFDAK